MAFYKKKKKAVKNDAKLYISWSLTLGKKEVSFCSLHPAWIIPTVLARNTVVVFYEFHIKTCHLIRSGGADNRRKEKPKKCSLGTGA